ncbi:sensor histidine kinase [Aeromicrobium sp. P5_D10]
MKQIILRAIALFQIVMVWAVVNTDAPLRQQLLLGLAHVVLMPLAWRASNSRFAVGPVLALVYIVVLFDWAVAGPIDTVLAFAGCWLANMTAAAPTFAMRGRRAVVFPVVVAFTLPVALTKINPEWGPDLPNAIVVTTLAIMIGTRVGVSFLFDFSARADTAASAAEQELRAVAEARTASDTAAEDARVLHDTVINTLGAIANGGASTKDVDLVRARCSADAATVESLWTSKGAVPTQRVELRSIFALEDLTVNRSGLDDSQLKRVEGDLPDQVIHAMVAAVGEVLRNVVKHADTDRAAVDVRLVDKELIVTVSDDGAGFDGVLPPGRGFAESVQSRAEKAGISVTLDTAPGHGTTVAFRIHPDSAAQVDPFETATGRDGLEIESVVGALHSRSGWLWPPGVTLVGLVLALTSTPTVGVVYAMLAVGALASALAWFTRDQQGHIPTGAVIVLAIGASVSFILSAAATDFGRSDVVLWQAVAPTAPLVPLIADTSGRRKLAAALALLMATVLVLTVIVWQDSATAAAVIPVAGITAIGLVLGWAAFQEAIGRTGAQAAADDRAAARSRLEVAVRVAAENSRQRWSLAGLHQAVDLLRDIADGRVDPASESARAACAGEEAYLRQLTQLNPELVRLGQWFAQALYDGRARQGDLIVRTGEVDAPTDEIATNLGGVLTRAVASMPATGARLSASVFPSPEGLRMTLVSPHPHLKHAHRAWIPSATSSVTYQTVEGQDVIEIVVHEVGLEAAL